MAGRARTNAIADELAKRVKETFDPDPDENPQPNALDYVCHWMECGKTAKALAADLSEHLPFECDYAMLMRHLRTTHGPAAEDAMDQARARASHSLAEDALGLIDAADRDSSSSVAKAAAQARSRQWMAERYNPSRFGSNKGVNVSISVTALHLDALRATPKGVTGGTTQHGDALSVCQHANAQVVDVPAVTVLANADSSHTSD